MNKESVKIPYNGKTGAIINLKDKKIYIEKNLSSNERRELVAIAGAYVEFYADEGKIPKHEEALIFAAYSLIPNGNENCFGKPVSSFSAKELASLAGVTEDFAKFRLGLEKVVFDPSNN